MYAPDPPRSVPRGQRGVSIVEVMVGMVVALLVGLAATGSALMFSASQRQGIGTGGSLINASTALTALRDDVAAAGLGFFGDRQFLCSKLNLSVGAAVVRDGTDFAPLNVTAEAAGDRIDIVSATQVAAGANVLLNAATTGASAALRSLLPVSAGQAVLLAPAAPGDPCLVRTVTGVTASTDDTPQMLEFAASAATGVSLAHNLGTFTTNPTYPDKGRVALLGGLNWTRYRLQGTDLRLERPLGGDPVVLVRNVVAFRAEYGRSSAAAGSTTLETWDDSASVPAMSASGLPRVRALRVGLVTRSPQAEKPNPATGLCEATATMPTLFGAAVTSDVTDWQCYRYRSAIVVVPLRNLVMGMTP